MRALLTGVPGAGKSRIAETLRDRYGFTLLDFESATLMDYWGADGIKASRIAAITSDVVIDWGFRPQEQLSSVLDLRSLGFVWFWLDGDRTAARNAFVRRGTVSTKALDLQMRRIGSFLDPKLVALAPVKLPTFDRTGNHLSLSDLATEVIRECRARASHVGR